MPPEEDDLFAAARRRYEEGRAEEGDPYFCSRCDAMYDDEHECSGRESDGEDEEC